MLDMKHLDELSNYALADGAQTSLQLGSVLLRGLGVMSDDVRFLRRMMRESMELRAHEAIDKKENKETDWLVPFQVHQLWPSLLCLRTL